jgi:2-polyprenyl-3-methyl-5-hydroxy-6-metoxy-1,4-benzoquinol methylase
VKKNLRKKVYGFEIIKNFINKDKNYSILDLGCGKVPFFLEFKKNFKKYHGIDVSMNDDAYDNIILKKKKIEQIDIREMNKYDLILVIDVLHHLKTEAIEKLLIKLSKLNPGKIIIIKDPIDTNLFYRTIHILHDFVINHELIHFKGHKLVEAYMKKNIDTKIIRNNFWYKNIFFKIII